MVSIFEYEVEPAGRDRFERAYGPEGEWAAFFRTGDGYLGTELHRSEGDPARYLVIDRWFSADAYSAFLDEHRSEYDDRSRATATLYRREIVVGRFTPTAGPARPGLDLLPGLFAVCRLDAAAPVPDWAAGGTTAFCSVTRTPHELSIVCPEETAPEGVSAERGWRCLRVRGPLDFGQTGIAAALTAPLATAAVPVLVIATHDTDYLLVRDDRLTRATAALVGAGIEVAPVGSCAPD